MWPECLDGGHLCGLNVCVRKTEVLHKQVSDPAFPHYVSDPLPPPPPCKVPPLAIPPPPGDRHFHVVLVNMYCAGLCCPSALRMALHCFPSTTNQTPNRACATIQSVLFSYPEVLYRSFGSSITFVLDETHWHRINAKVASHVFSLLASVEGTTVCLEIPLQSPPPPPRETVTW